MGPRSAPFLEETPSVAEIGVAGARGLAEAFNPAAGVVPLSAKSEAGFRAGADTTNVDSVMAIALL